MTVSNQECLVCKMIHAIRNPIPYQDMLIQLTMRESDGTEYHNIHPSVDMWAGNIYLAAELGYKPEQVFCHDHYYHYLHMKRNSPEAQRQAELTK